MRYTYMYSDAAGESQFEDVEVTMAPGPNLPPAIPALLSDGWPAGRVRFLEFPPGLDISHPAPARQFFIVLAGEIRVTTSDGKSRTFGAGEVGLAGDISGKGHRTATVGATAAHLAITELQ